MVATALENGAGVQAPALPDTLTLKPRVGYCADCGTWDSHGRFCAACGYDFAPVPDPDLDDSAL